MIGDFAPVTLTASRSRSPFGNSLEGQNGIWSKRPMLEPSALPDTCRMGDAVDGARSVARLSPLERPSSAKQPRFATSLLMAALVVGAAIALATTQWVTANPGGAEAPSPAQVAYPGTGFGGYLWHGPVSQISAAWRVPAIAGDSPAGHASTWVGAQTREGGAPFIQLGTVEDSWGGRQNYYQAFWSDTTQDFHPQTIAFVRPGDLVSASMVRDNDEWELSFVDLTSHHSHEVKVQYGAGRIPNVAEWFQEDPTPGDVTATDLPYPTMSAVTFRHLMVNNAVPKLNRPGFDGDSGYMTPTSSWSVFSAA